MNMFKNENKTKVKNERIGFNRMIVMLPDVHSNCINRAKNNAASQQS